MGKKIAFLGIDMGTTGIRTILSDDQGQILSVYTGNVLSSTVSSNDDKVSEQDPKYWKSALLNILKRALASIGSYELRAIAVDSTSGTIIPIDNGGQPLYRALMHNDVRAQEEARFILKNTGMNVKPSFALSKILWIKNNKPKLFEKTAKFIHAADYLKGLISGDFTTTDFSNAVKTGYDLKRYEWPELIDKKLGIPIQKLPKVVKTGEVFGKLDRSFCEEAGIKNEVAIVAGATDSTTSFFSSGAERIGDWNTTLGTVLAFRGIAPQFIEDAEGLLYTHRHPEGYWLPGAASNTGGESIRMFFGDRLEEYDERIVGTPPTGGLIYPLVRKSEKFPFLNMEAVGFIKSELKDPYHMFKGFLEGVTFVERMTYEKIQRIGYRVGDSLFTMGGGAYSAPWMQIRADILKKRICRAREVEAAFGAAIIAASGVHFGNLTDAQENMVNIERVVEPDPAVSSVYDEIYSRFLEECSSRKLY